MALFSNLKLQEEPDDEMKEMTFIPAVFRHNPSGFQFQLVVGDFQLDAETFKKYDKDSLDVSFGYYDEKRPDVTITVYVYPTLKYLVAAMLEDDPTKETIDVEEAVKTGNPDVLQQLAETEFALAVDDVTEAHPDAEIENAGRNEEPASCTKFLGSGANFTFTDERDPDKPEIESYLLILPFCNGKWSVKFRVSWTKGSHDPDSLMGSFFNQFPLYFAEPNIGDRCQ